MKVAMTLMTAVMSFSARGGVVLGAAAGAGAAQSGRGRGGGEGRALREGEWGVDDGCG
jgi:hypothetical protein